MSEQHERLYNACRRYLEFDISAIDRKIESLRVSIDDSLFKTDTGRYISLLEREFKNEGRIHELRKKKLEIMRKQELARKVLPKLERTLKKPVREQMDSFRHRHSSLFDMLGLWHRTRNIYLETAINNYIQDKGLGNFMNSTAKYHPHEKVTRSLGKYNAVAYYHAKDFTNQQRSYRLDKLEERVQRLEKKYDTIQRFEKSAKELEQAAYRITGTTRKKGFFEFIISGAKQFAQKYKDYRKYNGNKR